MDKREHITNGLNRRSFLKAGSIAIGAAVIDIPKIPLAFAESTSNKKLDMVKIGIVGVGNRGTYLLNILNGLKDCRGSALCDIVPEKVEHGKN